MGLIRRRAFLAAGISFIAAASLPFSAHSNSSVSFSEAELAQFMAVSLRLTDRDTLDNDIGRALYQTLLLANPGRRQDVGQLHALLSGATFNSATDFARAAEQTSASLKETIHDLMHGWYRGVVGQTVVVYRSALMCALTLDGVYPKTYALAKPFYWTERPPIVEEPHGIPGLTPSTYVAESQ